MFPSGNIGVDPEEFTIILIKNNIHILKIMKCVVLNIPNLKNMYGFNQIKV